MTPITYILLTASFLLAQSTYLPEKDPRRTDFLSYEHVRNAVMDAEELLSTGGSVVLSEKENLANRIFMKHKLTEISDGVNNSDNYAPGMHFFKAKPLIEKSKVYQMIKEMPKGALLHAHNSAQVSSEWVIKNLTYMPGLLSCVNSRGVTILAFRESSYHDCKTTYSVVSEDRKNASDKDKFDRKLEKTINLYTPIPEIQYPTLNRVWAKFQTFFRTVSDLFTYVPAYRDYHWRMLEEMHQDGVMYTELRMDFKTLYDSNGFEYEKEFSIRELLDVVDRFCAEHPDFLGVKVIFSTSRRVDKDRVATAMEMFKKYHEMYPNFVIGFDLVGQEDLGNPLYDFFDQLNTLPLTAKYFFHAGETNSNGASTDYNLLDAILLNTTRIGHGYALLKHPVLWNAVKKRGIAIEVSPLSNQVLNLVWDLRNHPAAFYFSEDIPVVIANDDPGFWNSKGLSYDMYYAIMSFAPNHAGLRTLKQLVWNSVKYSVLNESERMKGYRILERKWDEFLDRVIADDVLAYETENKT